MIRIALIPMLFAAQVAAGQTVLEGGPEWRAQRAEVFSTVCMAAAPDFSSFDTLAEKAGLERIDAGWHLPPEAVVRLVPHDGFCSCFVTSGAPDQAAMVDTIHARLMADWADSFTGKADGLASVSPFQRGGIEAVSILEPKKLDGQNWLAARVSVFGDCPFTEAGR